MFCCFSTFIYFIILLNKAIKAIVSKLTYKLIFNKSAKDIIDNVNIFFEGIGFTVAITTIFTFVLKWTLFNSVKHKKQALSAIKKAQILITDI